jgi:hypothetical protein
MGLPWLYELDGESMVDLFGVRTDEDEFLTIQPIR